MKILKAMWVVLLCGLLAACNTDKKDQNTPPPIQGDFTVNVSTPKLKTLETGETKLVVDFTVHDGFGQPYQFDLSRPFRIAVLKAMPERSSSNRDGNSYWKSFHHSSRSPFKAEMEQVKDGVLEQKDGGYSYTFAIPDIMKVVDPYIVDSVDNEGFIAWDADKLHRIVMAYGQEGYGFTHVHEWVPDPSAAVETVSRNIIEFENCESCHMGEPLYHNSSNGDYRAIDNNFAVCAACHNDSNPGAAPSRRPLSAIVHQKHGNIFQVGSDKEPVVDEEGNPVVVGSPFPQDARNCTTCHNDVSEKTPDANNWFEHPSQQTCETCHLVRDTQGSQAGGAHPYQLGTNWEGKTSCTGCHKPYNDDGSDASRSARSVHLGRLDNLEMARDLVDIAIEEASFSASTYHVRARVMLDGRGIEAMSELTPFIKTGKAYLLINWDNGQGAEIGYSSPLNFVAANTINLASDACTAEGNGWFSCSKTFGEDDKQPEAGSILTVSVAEMPLCADRRSGELKECASFTDFENINNRGLIAANTTTASFDQSGFGDNHQFVFGAEKELCSTCHEGFTIHLENHAATELYQCASCHNAERVSWYDGIPGDLKYHVHSFHAFGSKREGGSDFPGALNNCESCHTAEQYHLPNQQNARPSAINVGGEAKYFSPALVTCGSCHLESALGKVNTSNPALGDKAISHMLRNGAVFAADSAAEATGIEQCASCHGVGQEAGVDRVHNIYDYR
ncbi:cytochrome C [Photobacterium gaetbulicola]|uniref:Deca-heme c-type cytochrome n=1 Tax=Photobacterium gaetbulicola Gung47 TaxID=658445 RepID=A0A0C5WQZ1_9GAMM|nr:OmcA/MtrC family decaheme c-type cytochrome [Photobacterium gaetbulicola]AJR05370.1 deca-heme c-type cytochrome [Photobacterium gaetbulicola Gung47]PSU12694.1 cytochrome C [Photobacterium gaetbulicola]